MCNYEKSIIKLFLVGDDRYFAPIKDLLRVHFGLELRDRKSTFAPLHLWGHINEFKALNGLLSDAPELVPTFLGMPQVCQDFRRGFWEVAIKRFDADRNARKG